MSGRREVGARGPAPSTSADSPRRPEPRPGRSRARLSLLLPVLALLLGALSLFHAAPAGAQTVTLVTNFSQTKASFSPYNSNRRALAQGFTTGGTYPYFLSSIDVIARTSITAAERASLRAELWSASGNLPGAKLADLTVPADAGADRTYRESLGRSSQTVSVSTTQHGQFVSFGAPANTRLELNTTYFLVLRGTSNSFIPSWDVTRLDGEDKYVSQPGWSIANSLFLSATNVPDTTSFSPRSGRILQIKVSGRSTATATVSLSTSPSQVWEGAPVRVDATLSRALPHDVDIPITVKPCPQGSWCARFANRSIRIPAGFTSGNLRVPVPGQSQWNSAVSAWIGTHSGIQTVRDTNADNEEITVALGSNLPAGVRAGRTASRTVRILDMDGYAMTLSVDRAAAEKGEDVTLTVDLGRPAPDGFSVEIEGTGTAKAGRGRVIEEPKEHDEHIHTDWGISGAQLGDGGKLRMILRNWGDARTKTVKLRIVDDILVDPNETIVLRASGTAPGLPFAQGGAAFGSAVPGLNSNELTLTIADDESGESGAGDAPLQVGILDTVTHETDATNTARVRVWLSRPASQDVSVDYATADGTARSDGTVAAGTLDYAPNSGKLTFAPGETRKEIAVVVFNDTVEDSGETFEVVLSNPTPAGVRLVDARATVTIRNSEADLDGLTVQGAPGAGGPYANLDIGAFAAGTTDYAVTVPNGTTHARMLAKTDDRLLGLKTGAGSELTVVNRGEWGPVVALEVGANTLVMVASASSGDQRTYRVTVTREARALSSNADLSGLSVEGGADGAWSALDLGAFAAGTTSYTVSVPYGTTHARLTATAAHANAKVKAGVAGSLSAVSSGSAGSAAALSVGDNALAVEVTAEDGAQRTYRVTVTREAAQQESEPEPQEVVQQEEESAQQQQSLDPLTATLENVPPAHDGGAAFAIDLRFSEALGGGGVAPVAASFRVAYGSVAGAERVSAGLWRVRVQPKNWKDVTVTLSTPPDCAEAGAVCASGGRALSNALTATIGGPVRVRVEGARQSGDARAKEGKDASLDFAVTLNRAVSHEVSVDYATEDDTATAGADYTAVSGTLVFAAGETAKTVSVPVLDDAVDEGKEVMHLKLSNPRGAYLRSIHRQGMGIIHNDDPLQRAWLARFGRTAAGHVSEAIGGRLRGEPGRRVVLGGQQLAGGGAFFAQAPGRGDGASGGRPGRSSLPAGSLGLRTGEEREAPWRELEMSELLLASSFHLASAESMDASSRWSVWGRGARTSFEGTGDGLSLDGDVTTATVGFDYERARWLVGVALARSSGDGAFRAGGCVRYGLLGRTGELPHGGVPLRALPCERYVLGLGRGGPRAGGHEARARGAGVDGGRRGYGDGGGGRAGCPAARSHGGRVRARAPRGRPGDEHALGRGGGPGGDRGGDEARTPGAGGFALVRGGGGDADALGGDRVQERFGGRGDGRGRRGGRFASLRLGGPLGGGEGAQPARPRRERIRGVGRERFGGIRSRR